MFIPVEWQSQVEQFAGTVLTGAASLMLDNPEATLVTTVSILGGLVLVGIARRLSHRKAETGETLTMVKRRVLLDEKFADMIGDGLFDMLHREEISREEYKKACRRFGIAYNLTDLLVAKNAKRGMTARVKNNIRQMKLLDASGVPIQPKIPGPKIAEVTPVPQIKPSAPKRWVAKGKSLLRNAAA